MWTALAVVTAIPHLSGSGPKVKSPGGPKTTKNCHSWRGVIGQSLSLTLTLAAPHQMACTTASLAGAATFTCRYGCAFSANRVPDPKKLVMKLKVFETKLKTAQEQ